jgi:hypothetical protein
MGAVVSREEAFRGVAHLPAGGLVSNKHGIDELRRGTCYQSYRSIMVFICPERGTGLTYVHPGRRTMAHCGVWSTC